MGGCAFDTGEVEYRRLIPKHTHTDTHIERERDGLKTDVCVMILGLFQNKRTNAN